MNGASIEPVRTEFAFEANVRCEAMRVVGPSKYGHHQLVPIVGGTFAGPRIRGEVLPGGADWQLIRPDGVLEIVARYTLRADDGALISVCNRGIAHLQRGAGDSASGPQRGPYVRTVPEFQAPSASPHEWLNQWLFLGTLRVLSFNPLLVQVRVFRVL